MVISALVCLITGIILSVKHRKKALQREKEEAKASKPNKSSPKNDLIHYYSYNLCPANFSNQLFKSLREMDLTDPLKRPKNQMDDWFKKQTKRICHDASCLAYINHYGHLETAFWKNAEELGLKLGEDKRFQRLLISVYESAGMYFSNFRNLLLIFATKYTLLPEVENILKTDNRFKPSKDTYEHGRQVALKEQNKKKS